MRANGGKMHFGPMVFSHFVTKTLNLPGSIEHLGIELQTLRGQTFLEATQA